MIPPIEFYVLSEKGCSRTSNQDAWMKGSRNHFFLLADGVGGAPAGSLAAQESVVYLSKLLEERSPLLSAEGTREGVVRSLESALHATNQHIWEMGQQNPALTGMASTLSALAFFQSECFFANIGDSRIYLLRQHSLQLLTQDDSLLFELVQFGLINEKEARTFPLRHIITRSIGRQQSLECGWKSLPISPNDLFLLCCDGVSGVLPDNCIELILRQTNSLKEAAHQLLRAALRAGSRDNITIMLVKLLST